MERQKTKRVKVGKVIIGGGSPITVQSMTKTYTRDVAATVRQIKSLEKAGCDIVRVAVADKDDARAIKAIKAKISIPLVADIHFNHILALMAIESGADKIRINPGNIGGKSEVREIVKACKDMNIPIRIGVNSGSLEPDLRKKYGHFSGKGLVESAMRSVSLLGGLGFKDIVISVKSTGVPATMEAYEELSRRTDHPLHIGITEAGLGMSGIVRSSVGIGSLLSRGIGDTIRVSLTGEPVQEVITGIAILKSLELKRGGVRIISCPTCGRCSIDIEKIVKSIEEKTGNISKPIVVAVMGCAVNGPGEAKEADIGIAGGVKKGTLFKKGRVLRNIPENRIVDEVIREIKDLEGNK